jgi:hypothetical protein
MLLKACWSSNSTIAYAESYVVSMYLLRLRVEGILPCSRSCKYTRSSLNLGASIIDSGSCLFNIRSSSRPLKVLTSNDIAARFLSYDAS